MNTGEGAPVGAGPGGSRSGSLTLIHTNNCSNPASMRVSSVLPSLEEQVQLYEFKAAWCDSHGFPIDALAHRAYVAQLRRADGRKT